MGKTTITAKKNLKMCRNQPRFGGTIVLKGDGTLEAHCNILGGG
jgi:hypothetical protein